MDYYNDNEYLQEEVFYDDEKENSYMNYLLRQRRKRKEKLLRNNAYRDEYSHDFNDDLPYDDEQ